MSRACVEPVISVQDVHFSYNPQSDRPIHALRGVRLDIYPGDYLVVIGHNGSGKSTLAKHFNALLQPTAGTVQVQGLDTRKRANILAIRSSVGMVFQVPDNQIVASVVEEDIAFGAENLGVPEDELLRRVDWALEAVGMSEHRHRQPHLLSAGQKQRVAIAGAMAMKPEVLVLDEATSMLDPEGRRDVLAAIRTLRGEGVTVVAITHSMEEVTEGNRVVILEKGRIAMENSPRQVFARVGELRTLQLGVPQATELAYRLNQRDPAFPPNLLTVDEVADVTGRLAANPPVPRVATRRTEAAPRTSAEQPLIQVCDLHYTYLRGTPLEATALHGVSLEIDRGEAVGLIGRTGSGKSTLVQHLNGLLRPREAGKVRVAGRDLSDPDLDMRRIRQRVGLVFQYPEQQLFERLVGDDVAFGPKRLGLAREERRERVRWAMEMAGLDFEAFKDRHTFSLSGGEMRKAALAGVLALQPEVLILDESTTGLDPRSRQEMLDRLQVMHQEQGLTLLIVSPSMEEVAGIVDRVYVMDAGRTALSGPVRAVFDQPEALSRYGLGVPQVTQVAHELERRGVDVGRLPLTVDEGLETLWRILKS